MKVAIYGTGIIATLLLFTAGIIFNSHRIAAVWIIFATIVTYALSFSLYWHDDIKSKPRLKEPMFAENTENFTFSLGERGFSIGYSKKALEKNHINTGFVFGDYHPVDLYIENGKLYADVKIYGGSGLPPIEIKKNKLFNKPQDWDFNSNEKAMEIVNDKGVPVYQFFYKKPSHIVMNGIFPYPGGLLLANENGVTQNPLLTTKFKLNKIFKYPSWKYPGEYEER